MSLIKPDKELDVVIRAPDGCPVCGEPLSDVEAHAECADSVAANAGRRTTRRDGLDDVTRKLVDGPKLASPEVLAKRELAQRELCRRKFMPFILRMKPDYMAGWFHHDLAARLERFVYRVERGESPRMLINVPPRRGKSEQASKALPAWFLGRNPQKSIIATTHSDELANDNSRDVLDYIRAEQYSTVFPGTTLHKDNQGATGWRTNAGGRYKPGGVGKGIAGRGADILLIDDPHRDKDAYSATVRQGIGRWYRSSARTRLMPGGGIIIIQTRWVLDDLTGMVLEEEGRIEDGGVWEHVVYPEEAVTDEYRLPSGLIVTSPQPGAVKLRSQGECLHPERYPPESNIEHKRDAVTWAALYQQNPVAGEAALFQADWFKPCTLADVPRRLAKYATWDTAVEQKESSAFTVGMVGGVDDEDNLWIVDIVREKLDGLGIVEAILDLYEQHGEEATGIEKTNHAVATKPFLEKRIEERGITGINVVDLLHGNKDKVMRARPIQARSRQGKVMIPTDAPWYADFMKELLAFPASDTADQVDAFAHLGQLLEEMGPPRRIRQKKQKSWRDKLNKYVKKAPTRDWRSA